MNPLAREFLEFAERDRATAERELTVSDGFNAFAVSFHCQQAAEKAIKSLLVSREIVAPRTHDLVRLAFLLENSGLRVPVQQADLELLNPGAVNGRYQG